MLAAGAGRIVHITRNPTQLVMSGYVYHRKAAEADLGAPKKGCPKGGCPKGCRRHSLFCGVLGFLGLGFIGVWGL